MDPLRQALGWTPHLREYLLLESQKSSGPAPPKAGCSRSTPAPRRRRTDRRLWSIFPERIRRQAGPHTLIDGSAAHPTAPCNSMRCPEGIRAQSAARVGRLLPIARANCRAPRRERGESGADRVPASRPSAAAASTVTPCASGVPGAAIRARGGRRRCERPRRARSLGEFRRPAKFMRKISELADGRAERVSEPVARKVR